MTPWRRPVGAGSRVPRGRLPLVILALLLAGCSATGPSPSGSGGVPASPSSPAASPTTGPLPVDDITDPIGPSPSVPSFAPPVDVTPAPGAVGIVLRVPVLLYHRIVPRALAGDARPSLVVAPDVFAAQMAALASAGWHTITAARLAADLAAGVAPPPKTFVITIDDGYDDGFTYALPILEAHGFVATYFVVAGRIGDPASPAALTVAHVVALAAAGMEIANHTFSHLDLATATASMVRFQVVAASARIAALVGRAPVTFAYPFGRWTVPVAAEVLDAGLAIAFTTVEGARETWATRFALPRIEIGPAVGPFDLLARLDLLTR